MNSARGSCGSAISHLERGFSLRFIVDCATGAGAGAGGAGRRGHRRLRCGLRSRGASHRVNQDHGIGVVHQERVWRPSGLSWGRLAFLNGLQLLDCLAFFSLELVEQAPFPQVKRTARAAFRRTLFVAVGATVAWPALAPRKRRNRCSESANVPNAGPRPRSRARRGVWRGSGSQPGGSLFPVARRRDVISSKGSGPPGSVRCPGGPRFGPAPCRGIF